MGPLSIKHPTLFQFVKILNTATGISNYSGNIYYETFYIQIEYTRKNGVGLSYPSLE